MNEVLSVEVLGKELAIKWKDGREAFIPLEKLRRMCPCAACAGETDIMGNLHRGPQQEYSPAAFHLMELRPVGSYGLQPLWGDGHATGIFSFDYLRRITGSSSPF